MENMMINHGLWSKKRFGKVIHLQTINCQAAVWLHRSLDRGGDPCRRESKEYLDANVSDMS
jgi:hypothetical protein